MNNYEREVIGDIIIVKGLTFLNTLTEMQESDHAWVKGRPCLIIYSDEEYDYILTLTSTERYGKYKEQYFKINEKHILYKEDFKYRRNRKNRINKNIKGSVNIETIYKIPTSGHDKLGKITFEAYKQIINQLKTYHQNQDINKILERAAIIRQLYISQV